MKTTLIYVTNGDEVLFLRRDKREQDMHQGRCVGLGGKHLPGESDEDCARREIFEESGLSDIRLRKRGVIRFPEFKPGTDILSVVYTAETTSREVTENEEGHLIWVKRQDIAMLPLWEGDTIFLDWVFTRNDMFDATFRYEEGIFKDYEVRFMEEI